MRPCFPPRLACRPTAQEAKVPRLRGLPSRAQGAPKRREFRRTVASPNSKRQQPGRIVSRHSKRNQSRQIMDLFTKRHQSLHLISLRARRHQSRRIVLLRAKRDQCLRAGECTAAAAAASGGNETPTIWRREREFRKGLFLEAFWSRGRARDGRGDYGEPRCGWGG